MKLIKEFSVAQRINVSVYGTVNSSCESFLKMIYHNFDNTIEAPKYHLKINVSDVIPKIKKTVELGKDAFYDENTLVLKSGHYFIRDSEKSLTVGIPTKVKRGRIPFKRTTPGRHITDEIIEPLLQLLLLNCNATFVHASSIYKDGKVDVLMGWRGTGKTNAILKDMSKNNIWSDDLAIIDNHGYVYPYLRPIRIYSYNIPLLDPEYISKHKLKFKRRITPPWQPVHYLPLSTETGVKSAPLNEFIYLNDRTSKKLAKDAKNIMLFEQIYFKDYQIMLEQAGVFKVKNKVGYIINEALKNAANLLK
ncbi:hypothetical protein [Arenibacter troitsensis]|uniref:HprK-related kinase B n=1 Tax=Arenibacter troitsensis TaxID=188872 RepID=A0A1X7KR03_9FLAO|nr:hypothetical protein [Arenibacter troitsensis]SMG43632.1 hypothetical protein SAMN03080602_03182 [Arenibacter troitsensis]